MSYVEKDTKGMPKKHIAQKFNPVEKNMNLKANGPVADQQIHNDPMNTVVIGGKKHFRHHAPNKQTKTKIGK